MLPRTIAACCALLAFALGACSAFDPSRGAPCDEYPTLCGRRPAPVAPSPAPTTSAPPGDAGSPAPDAGPAAPTVSFKRDIRPLLDRTETDATGPGCSLCHYRTTGMQTGIQEARLDMTTLGDLRRGGKTSEARVIVAGDPNASVLIQKLRGTYPIGSRMPWNGPPYWSDAEIDLVAKWIAEGAHGADDE